MSFTEEETWDALITNGVRINIDECIFVDYGLYRSDLKIYLFNKLVLTQPFYTAEPLSSETRLEDLTIEEQEYIVNMVKN